MNRYTETLTVHVDAAMLHRLAVIRRAVARRAPGRAVSQAALVREILHRGLRDSALIEALAAPYPAGDPL